MNYTGEALTGLRRNLADALDGRVSMDKLLHRTRRSTDGAIRITRRPGDAKVEWHRGNWPMTVADVCTATPEEYVQRVMRWANSVRETLDATGPSISPGLGHAKKTTDE